MERTERVLKQISVRRRCDDCGIRTYVTFDDGEKCTLKCSQCGREYRFSSNARSRQGIEVDSFRYLP
jgi:ribosomal protein L33